MHIVSRGGSLVFAWMSMTGEENPFYEYYDEILDICREYDVTISLADARRTFDWETQWECSIDPETAKAIRNSRAPEQEDSCSMCGKFCAVRSMNKALAGEYIDIL